MTTNRVGDMFTCKKKVQGWHTEVCGFFCSIWKVGTLKLNESDVQKQSKATPRAPQFTRMSVRLVPALWLCAESCQNLQIPMMWLREHASFFNDYSLRALYSKNITSCSFSFMKKQCCCILNRQFQRIQLLLDCLNTDHLAQFGLWAPIVWFL